MPIAEVDVSAPATVVCFVEPDAHHRRANFGRCVFMPVPSISFGNARESLFLFTQTCRRTALQHG